MRKEFENKRKIRLERFEEVVKKLRAEVESLTKEKGFSAGEWERDFRRINPDPADNEALDG